MEKFDNVGVQRAIEKWRSTTVSLAIIISRAAIALREGGFVFSSVCLFVGVWVCLVVNGITLESFELWS